MQDGKRRAYHDRMQTVLDYIHEHIDRRPTVEELARVAHFSKYHFHRQFSAYVGTGVYKYIQSLRLKRAAYRLAFRRSQPVTEVALEAGFTSPEAFSRAFKKRFSLSPSEFRRQPFQALRRSEAAVGGRTAPAVALVQFPETPVAALAHHGPLETVFHTVRTFIRWRQENQLPPGKSATYNVFHPAADGSGAFSVDLCAATGADVKENPYGVTAKTIPGGRCAVVRHVGADENIEESVDYLYGSWFPGSGEALRDAPCFFHRVSLFPDVAEHEMVTDIYLPLV